MGILRLFYDITEYTQDVIIYLQIHVRGFNRNFQLSSRFLGEFLASMDFDFE